MRGSRASLASLVAEIFGLDSGSALLLVTARSSC
jgi:hypothetical protein